MSLTTKRVEISGVSIDLVEGGEGSALLYLHGGRGHFGFEPFMEELAKTHRVIAPWLPGFGHSELPRSYTAIDDLAYFGLDLIDSMDLRDAALVGAGFGGWVAAEMAIRSTERLGSLSLIGALGVKFADHLTREITDIHALYPDEVQKTLYSDPERFRLETEGMSDEDLTALVRLGEAVVLFGWKPYMHNPRLRQWLHRVNVPTLVTWGEKDAMVTVDYGRKYAAAIPDARFEIVSGAGHYPGLEQPAETATLISGFAGGKG
jgi:pimeloyl-ACP methyl ester carboxylesterase